MKLLIATLSIVIQVTTAAAQIPWPRTVPWNDASGKPIGTATFSGNRIYLRDTKNELVATVQIDADGTRTLFDPNGKVLDRIDAEPPK